ncbi:MAG: hypothetical protein ACRELD_00210 [Longimicrobiales bacterium]
MAIKDLFWACPLCSSPQAVQRVGRHHACRACNARFVRGRADLIRAIRRGTEPEERTAGEWLRRLRPIHLDGGEPILRSRVRIRVADHDRPVHGAGGEYLGRHEVFGPTIKGHLILTADALTFEPDGTDAPRRWPLDTLTAVGASSSLLQARTRQGRLHEIRFPIASLRVWDELLRQALREHHRRRGREIVEFLPRIITR